MERWHSARWRTDSAVEASLEAQYDGYRLAKFVS
jgi:hypothetical protein